MEMSKRGRGRSITLVVILLVVVVAAVTATACITYVAVQVIIIIIVATVAHSLLMVQGGRSRLHLHDGGDDSFCGFQWLVFLSPQNETVVTGAAGPLPFDFEVLRRTMDCMGYTMIFHKPYRRARLACSLIGKARVFPDWLLRFRRRRHNL